MNKRLVTIAAAILIGTSAAACGASATQDSGVPAAAASTASAAVGHAGAALEVPPEMDSSTLAALQAAWPAMPCSADCSLP